MNFFYKSLKLVFYYIENKISDFYIKISGLKAPTANIPSYEVNSLRIFQASTIVTTVGVSNKAVNLYKKIFFKEYIKIFSSKILMKKVISLQDFSNEYNR